MVILHRTFNLCVHCELFHIKLNNLKLIYRSNGYLISFTDLHIRKHLGKPYACINAISLAPKK